MLSDLRITRKLTKNVIFTNKMRNFFILVAIILTAFMITSVFSMGISYVESINMRALRLQGSATHFAFFHPTPEQLYAVHGLDYVRHVGVAYNIGVIDTYPLIGASMFGHVDRVQWFEMFIPTFVNVEGSYAENENDVMISRRTLYAMGISDPFIGMEIPITFTHFNTGEEITDIFFLSKMFTDFTHASPEAQTHAIFTSYAVAERFNANILQNAAINIIFNNPALVAQSAARLKTDLGFSETQYYTIAPAFDNDFGGLSTLLGFAAVTIFLMLTGFMLIYNVMYMSVSRDVRFYGLLRTLGMTAQQIRRIVFKQSLWLCFIGIPVGLIVASLISFIIVPLYIETGIETGAVVSFSPIIYVGGTIFTILTVFLASLTPSKIAMRISPVESLRFVDSDTSKLKSKTRFQGNLIKLALRNIFREPKRVRLTILSLFFGITVFIAAATLTNSMDVEYVLNNRYHFDFMITSNQVGGTLSRDFTNVLSGTFDERVQIEKLISGGFVYSNVISDHVDYIATRDRLSRDYVISQLFDMYRLGLKSIDSRMFIEVTEGTLNPQSLYAFERGEIAFFSTRGFETFVQGEWILNEQRIGTFTVGSQLYMQIGPDLVPTQIIFGGFVDLKTPQSGWTSHAGTPEILVSDSFITRLVSSEFPGNYSAVDILSINLDAITDSEENYYHILQAILGAGENMFSRIAGRRFFEEALATIFILGSALAGVLATIGVFNFVNVMSSNVITRKREFALFECIGMSKQQMRKTIRFESLGYWLIAVLLSATIGNFLAYLMISFIARFDSAFLYELPFQKVISIVTLILVICLVVPEFVYKGLSRGTLVDRLRNGE